MTTPERPTAAVPTRDVSGLGIRASGARAGRDPQSSISEHALLQGYRGLPSDILRHTCACGGRIEAKATDDDIREAIEIHNLTTLHQQWRTWREAMP